GCGQSDPASGTGDRADGRWAVDPGRRLCHILRLVRGPGLPWRHHRGPCGGQLRGRAGCGGKLARPRRCARCRGGLFDGTGGRGCCRDGPSRPPVGAAIGVAIFNQISDARDTTPIVADERGTSGRITSRGGDDEDSTPIWFPPNHGNFNGEVSTVTLTRGCDDWTGRT